MEEEIIAKCISRKKRAWICLRGTMVGLALLAVGLYLLLRPGGTTDTSAFVASIAGIVIGALVCMASLVVLAKIYPFPPVIAAREGDMLVFLGERIPLCDIAEATFVLPQTLIWRPTHGLLRIRLKNGRILKNGCVDDVAQACFRLNECLRRYAAEQEQQSFAGNARRPDA